MLSASADARTPALDPHRGFRPGPWLEGADVRGFIQRNFTPYTGDAAFLAGPTERTTRVWDTLHGLMLKERERGGVLDVDAATPSSITAHAPGYISRDDELIVGLQTNAPLRRAIFPNGGWRMVESGLTAYGFEPDE
ncbi:MAG TPA: pyruvate formate lyase family protein, partial [Gaiellales bacterium]